MSHAPQSVAPDAVARATGRLVVSLAIRQRTVAMVIGSNEGNVSRWLRPDKPSAPNLVHLLLLGRRRDTRDFAVGMLRFVAGELGFRLEPAGGDKCETMPR